MRYAIFDIETNGLLDEVTTLHCLSYQIFEGFDPIGNKVTIYTEEEIALFFTQEKMLVGHKIIQYDIPALEIIYNVEIRNKLWCTLGISYYLFPLNKIHGLEFWGERLGFPKVTIDKAEWKGPLEGETMEQFRSKMTGRCEGDVEINTRLFHEQVKYLLEIYDNDMDDVIRVINYLSWKMDCLKDQEDKGIPLDEELCEATLLKLEPEIQGKIDSLASVMPKMVEKTRPKVFIKKNGDFSANGLKWLALLEEKGLSPETEIIYKLGNPGSHVQLKKWLFKLGWNPITFKENKKEEQIPQVSLPHGGGICPSVKELFEVEPNLMDLEGLYMLQHRQGVLNGFLKHKTKDGRVLATAQGFTNTIRLQHASPVVNLPGVDKAYGEEIRGCLKVPDDSYVMIGCDISGLEDNTKQHYMYFFDPDYVKQMRVPGFDPHLDIALFAGILSQEQVDFYKWFDAKTPDQKINESDENKAKFKVCKKGRSQAKTVNFAGVYGAGPPKIADTLKITVKEAKILHTAYWSRNKSVKQIGNSTIVKSVRGYKWQYNPIANMWYFLKAEKDRFSTLNQGSGSYVFDIWLRNTRIMLKEYGIKVVLQYHDELLFYCKKELEEELSAKVRQAMEDANDELKLNVRLKISVDPGLNYAECH